MRCLIDLPGDPLDGMTRETLAKIWIVGRMAELGLRPPEDKPLSEAVLLLWERLNGSGFVASESEVRAFLRARWGPELETTVRAVLGIGGEQEAA
jgi:hypothetical protein